MKNKILILSSVLCLGVIISYVAFGWSEPTGSMPSEYKTPINTSIDSQDVSEGKPVIVNLNSDQVDGYNASDLLAATSSGSSGMRIIVAHYQRDNPNLSFPACPTGFTAVAQDGIVQYNNQKNVPSLFYSTIDATYKPIIYFENGSEMTLYFNMLYKDYPAYATSQSSLCPPRNLSAYLMKMTCVGTYCSTTDFCSGFTSVSLAYSICEKNLLPGVMQGK